MRTMIIGFSTPKKFMIGSALIRLFEGTDYSHIYIKMKASPNSKLAFDKIFQASHGDVNAMTFETFEQKNEILHEYEIEMSDEKYFEIANWLWDQLGKPYGFLQLITIGLGIRTKRNEDSKFICSELAAKVLRDYLGYNISKSLDYIGLKDVKRLLESN